MKKKTKSKTPHRYFLIPGEGDQRIVVFKNSVDAGRSYFYSGHVGDNNWWRLHEMDGLGAIEVPATLIKKVARL